MRVPAEMQRAMGSEAEASRNAKAKVIEAEGELQASETLRQAADVMASNPNAMSLRFLQTITTVGRLKVLHLF